MYAFFLIRANVMLFFFFYFGANVMRRSIE